MKFRTVSLLALFILMFSLTSVLVGAQENSELLENSNNVTIYFFWGDGCPHCETEKPYLDEWQNKYPEVEVKMFETWKNSDNVPLFQEAAAAYGIEARGVPTTFIGEKNWVGFSSSMAPEMESYIQECISQGCKSPLNDSNFEKNNNSDKKTPNSLCLHIFTNEDCSQCESIIPYLESLEKEYELDIKKYDVSFEENKTLFNDFRENYGLKAEMYPTVFIGENYISGEESIKKALEPEIEKCLEEGCPCPVSKIRPYTPITANTDDVTFGDKQTVDVLGMKIDVGAMPLFFSTFLISFVDGFNPCSLFVLMFLLGIVIYTGSRKKIFAIGFTYLAVAGIIYGLFILMVFNVFLYVGYLFWIKFLVALVAFIFAAVNIKDFFWYKKGISFTIPDSYKPKIFKKVRNLMKHDGNFGGLILGSALLALGITLVELPCTAGLPWIWSSIMSQYELSFMYYAFLFLTYILVYFSIELVIFLTAVFTLNISKFEESHGRTLKLIGGLIMAMLGFVLLYDHTLMEDIGSTAILFIGTILLGLLIAWIYKKKVGFNPDRAKLDKNDVGSKEKDTNGKTENKKESLKSKEELNRLGGKNE